MAWVRTYTPEQRKHKVEHQLKVRKERLEKGICPMCGKRPLAFAVGGVIGCAIAVYILHVRGLW